MHGSWLAGFLAVAVCAPVLAAEKDDLAAEAWVVLEKGVRSGDMMARARAVEALPLVPGKADAAAPYLKDALQDHQWVVRKAAIKALSRQNPGEALDLAAEALGNPNLPLDEDAYDLMSGFKPKTGKNLLHQAILDPNNPAREALMEATLAQDISTVAEVMEAGLAAKDPFFESKLVMIRHEQKGPLAQKLLSSRHSAVVAAALRFIRDSGINVPESSLKRRLKSKDREVRFTAAELLARQGNSSAVKVLLPLLDGTHDDKLRFLKAAAEAPSEGLVPRLKKFLAPTTPVDLLVEVYRSFAGSTDIQVRKRVEEDLVATILPRRAAATRAIGRLLGTRALPRLYTLMNDGSPLIRRLAVEGVGELGQAESVERLERALRDTERDVRLAVVQALSRIHDKSVIGVASFVVYDPDPEIKKTAILAVCNVNHDDSLPILRIHVENPDPEIRYNVVRAMIYLDPGMALTYFDRALAGLRAGDLVALTELFREKFLPFLARAARSERAWAREGALRGAVLLPGRETDFLKESGATNPHADARRFALERLRVLSCPEALSLAEALKKDDDPEVRIVALETLVHCGDNSTLPLVQDGLFDREEIVRVTAARGLLQYPKGKVRKKRGRKKNKR
ncbi:MAG: HEAT repeat domain-containing protein [Deltaproteobacteria bacterium]|nr:HEAT repeat domain-containing protein [Deltaproteobacteria bacterium]